jgi:Synaptobrevin
VREVLSAPDFSNKVSAGARYRLVGDVNAFNFTTDPEQRVYIVISAFDYPERLVFPMINELVIKFKQEFGPSSLTCAASQLDSKARKLFQALADDYDDPTKRDKLAQVQAQVQGVKLTMGKNLDSMLKNIDKARDIEESSAQLQAQAAKFDEQAKVLKRRELCRKWQTTAFIVIALAIIITVVVVVIVGPSTGGSTNPPATSPPGQTPAATIAPTTF